MKGLKKIIAGAGAMISGTIGLSIFNLNLNILMIGANETPNGIPCIAFSILLLAGIVLMICGLLERE